MFKLFLSVLWVGGTLGPCLAWAIDELQRDELQVRCFVWHPEHCGKRNERADEELVGRVTKGFSRVEASQKITAHAWSLLQKKKVTEALFRFNQALLLNEKSTEAWRGAGAAAFDAGLNEDAEICWRRAVALDPKLVSAHYGIARVLFTKNDLLGARRSAEAAVAADSKFRDGHKLLALILYNQNQFTAAKQSYDRAVSLGATQEADFEGKLTRALSLGEKKK